MPVTAGTAILLHRDDNVATALVDLAEGTDAVLESDGQSRTVRVMQSIPKGHKFAVLTIPAGRGVLKYGEVIGLATKSIQAGQLVHTHNVASQRGRGDWAS